MDKIKKMLVNSGVIKDGNIDLEKLHTLLQSDISVNSEISFGEKLSMILIETLDNADNDVERIKILSKMFNSIKEIVIPDAPNLGAMMGGNMDGGHPPMNDMMGMGQAPEE